MASRKNARHEQRGFWMSVTSAEQVMRDHCTIVWVIPGETFRDTTDEERMELRAAQVEQSRMRGLTKGMLEDDHKFGEFGDLRNVRFERPKTTNYRAPREAYEEMEAPLAVRVCRWPRQFAMEAA